MANKEEYQSLANHTWKVFRSKKRSMFSLALIVFYLFIAILGYLITPDSTPYANDQIIELSLKPPGFSTEMLLIRKNYETEEVGFFSKMLFGEINNFRSIPIKNYKFDSHDIVFTVLNPNGSGGEEVHRVSVADILYPLNVNTKINNDFKKNILRFYDFESVTPISKSLKELQEKIIENNLIVKTYLLGTDPVGRDLLSRLMIGTRISFSVGLVAVFISVVIGVFLGAIAGYFRGFADEFIMWIINVVWSVPVLLLVIAISLALGKGFWQMFVAVGLTMWVEVARIVRGQLMSMREKEFVDAGRALGFSKSRIIFKHILPNVLSSVIIISAANFAGAILIEAGLSFLGIGAQAPVPSWGAMISSHRGYIIGSMPYLAFIPGLAIMSMVLAFVLIGNGLRDAMDTKFVDDENLIV